MLEDQAAPPSAPKHLPHGDEPPIPSRSARGLRRWFARWVVLAAIASAVLLVVILWAYVSYNDQRLGREVSRVLSRQLTGKFAVARVHWELRAMFDLLFGTATPVSLEQVSIRGPDGVEVIGVPRVRATVRLWPLIVRREIHLARVEVYGGHCTLAQLPSRHTGAGLGLVAAFESARRSAPKSRASRGDGPLINLPEIVIRGTRFHLEIGPTAFDLPDIDVDAWMRIEGDPSVRGMQLGGAVRFARGRWIQNGLPVPLSQVHSPNVRIDGQRLSVGTVRLFVNGAPMHVTGGLDHLFEASSVTIDARAALRQVGGAATRLFGFPVDGKAEVDLHVQGPVAEPYARATIDHVDARPPGIAVTALQATVALDVARSELTVRGFTARVLDGQLEGTGRLDFERRLWSARLDLRGVNPAAFVPALAGEVRGGVTLSGQLGGTETGHAVIDLALSRPRRRTDLLPTKISLRGSVHLSLPIIDLAGVTVEAEGNKLHAHGSINLLQRRVNVFLGLELPRLGHWLDRAFGVPLIRAAHSSMRLYGAYPRLKLRGELELQRIGDQTRYLDRLGATIRFTDGILKLSDIHGTGLGGELRGEASLQLFKGDLRTRLVRPLLHASMYASRFDLERMDLDQYASGLVSVQADVNGPVDALTGSARLKIPKLVIQGETYAPVEARIGLLRDRVSLYELRLPRARGGSLYARGELFRNRRVVGAFVRAERFPLAALPGLGHAPVGGELGGTLEVSGKLTDPRVHGELMLHDIRVRGARLGSGVFRFEPKPEAIAITGALGGDVIDVDGFAQLQPHPSLHLTVGFRRLPLHEAWPELAQLGVGRIQGLSTGAVRFDLDSESGLTWAEARLTELVFSLRYRPLGRRTSRRIALSNKDDLLFNYRAGRLQVVSAQLVSATPGRSGSQAQFSLNGFLARDHSDLTIRGQVPLGLAEFFLARRVQRISGVALANVKLTGPLSALVGVGSLDLQNLRVQLPGFDRPLELPEGRLRLRPGELRLERLRLRVGAEALQAWGALRLAPGSLFNPETLSLRLQGDLHLGLLQLLLPEQLSFARGSARIELALEGPVADPRADGELSLARVELRPRGLPGIVTIQQGRLSFSNYLVCLGGASVCADGGRSCPGYERTCRYDTPLQGSYDEGTVVASGQARLDQRELVDLELRVRAAGISQRKPNVYTAEFNADLRLVGDNQSLALDGGIDIVDGRYMQEFEILKDLVVKPRTYEQAEPFWRGVPLFEQMELRLLVRSSGSLLVRNRNADLALAAALSVSGTLDDPRLDGSIRVEEGTFRVPFLRGEYRVERGDILFEDGQPAEQAQLDILAETQYIDRGGTNYRIGMQLKGPLEHMRIRLTSQPHLDQGQILALLATGRTTNQWRTQLNSVEQGTAAAGVDTQVKELTGTLLGGMIGDPLERTFGLDLVRLEIGTETVTARACKNVGTALEFCGEGEKNLIGGFGGRAIVDYKIHDYIRLAGRLERLSTRIELEQQNPSRGRVELKFRLPLY